MDRPLDELGQCYAQAQARKRQEEREMAFAMMRHRRRTPQHRGLTGAEQEAHARRAARGRAEWLAAAAVLLFLLAVAGTYWGLHCPSLRAVGC